MKILKGLSDGMVMQRGKDGCDIRFTAEHRGTVSASIGRVEALQNRWVEGPSLA